MKAEALTQWSDVADTELWGAVRTEGLVAVNEVYRRHSSEAFKVAFAITQNAERAERAVVAAFVRLGRRGWSGERRPLRINVLDATRRCACELTDEITVGFPPLDSVGPGDVFRSLPLEARSVLALAVAGRCGDLGIAQVMGLDISAVRQALLVALDHARNCSASVAGTTRSPRRRRHDALADRLGRCDPKASRGGAGTICAVTSTLPARADVEA